MKANLCKLILPCVCASLVLSGCSSEAVDADTESAQESEAAQDGDMHTDYAVHDDLLPVAENVMPKMMTDLSYGGYVPDEYAGEVTEDPRYDLVALMGSWCVEGSTIDTPLQATDTMIEALFEPDSSGVTVTKMTCLPDTMVFGLNSSGFASSTLLDMYVYGWNYLLTDFSFRNQRDNSFTAILPYYIDGNTLAVGFYDSSGDDDAVLVQELDYLMEWTGWKLTLTYDGESVTYVPRNVIADEKNGYVTAGGKIVSGYTGIDGITAVYPADGEVVIDDETYKASFTFREDGTATIKVRRGNTYELEFRYSGDTLTLIDGDHAALYGTMYADEEE